MFYGPRLLCMYVLSSVISFRRSRYTRSRTAFCFATSPAILSWLAGSLTPILTSLVRATWAIALLWRFRELHKDLAS